MIKNTRNNALFSSIFGTVNANCTVSEQTPIQELSDESSDFNLSEDTVTQTCFRPSMPQRLESFSDLRSALSKVDALQYDAMTEDEKAKLQSTLEVRKVVSGEILTNRGDVAIGMYVVITEGPALVDDDTGEIVSSGALVDAETLLYNAQHCRCTIRGGSHDCNVALLPVSEFHTWTEPRVRFIFEAVPLFRTISIERLKEVPLTHMYKEKDATLDGVFVITSGVVIVKDDGPEARLFPGHIAGVRELFDEAVCNAYAETRVGIAQIAPGVIDELMQDETDFMIALGETVFQRSVVTEARMKRAASSNRRPCLSPGPSSRNLTHTQSIIGQRNAASTIVLETKVVLKRDEGASSINEYSVLRRLGTGATAAVYLCSKPDEDDADAVVHVAIKVVVKSKSRKSLDREIDSLKVLSHVNIISLLKIIDDPTCDKVFLVEEYAQGGSLNGVVMDLRDGQKCATDCLNALSYMHKRGYVHRDIKPANLVRMSDGTVKLADFGCAIKVGGAEDTIFAGTPAFMCPELCVGARVTPKVDVWALTATLHCIVYGKPPFDSYRRVELEDAILYRPPSTGAVDQSSGTSDELGYFKHLCKQGLTKDPDARITIQEMIRHPWLRSGR